jgi:hypothetical protein
MKLTFFEFHPPLNANILFCRFFFESHPVYDQTQDSGAVFLLLYRQLRKRLADILNIANTQKTQVEEKSRE